MYEVILDISLRPGYNHWGGIGQPVGKQVKKTKMAATGM